MLISFIQRMKFIQYRYIKQFLRYPKTFMGINITLLQEHIRSRGKWAWLIHIQPFSNPFLFYRQDISRIGHWCRFLIKFNPTQSEDNVVITKKFVSSASIIFINYLNVCVEHYFTSNQSPYPLIHHSWW